MSEEQKPKPEKQNPPPAPQPQPRPSQGKDLNSEYLKSPPKSKPK